MCLIKLICEYSLVFTEWNLFVKSSNEILISQSINFLEND